MTLNEWIVKADTSQLEFIKKYDKGFVCPIDDITYLPFIDIKKTIPALMDDGKYDEALSLVLKEDVSRTLKRDEVERFRIVVWIERQYEKINQIEKRYLERPPEFNLISAGIRNLDVLGLTNTIDMLAGGDVTKWQKVEQLPYSTCFEKQLKLVIESDIQKKLIEISKSKGKK